MVTVFGLGFVGLTTALGFAEMGHKVYGVEANKERMDVIRGGRLPFLEPGLDEALARHLGKNFFPCEDLHKAVAESDYIYYCVGTPYGEDGHADLTFLFKAMEQTLSRINDEKFRVLVIKSTIPPSTTKDKILPFLEKHGFWTGEKIGLANNPEFLREGHCWEDFIDTDRIVIGVEDDRSKALMRDLYKNSKAPLLCVSYNTGEFIKYLSNTLLATLISYSNEMSVIADKIGGIDTAEAFRVLHLDRRWNGCNMTTYAYPGCGYGGYCLPKDTNALYALTKSAGFDPPILKNVISTNDGMPDTIVERIKKQAPPTAVVGIMGLSFKPLSDDVRDTSAAKVIQKLLSAGYRRIFAYDPSANAPFKKLYPELEMGFCDSLDELIEQSDVLAIITAWDEFRTVRQKTGKPVVDCRFML